MSHCKALFLFLAGLAATSIFTFAAAAPDHLDNPLASSGIRSDRRQENNSDEVVHIIRFPQGTRYEDSNNHNNVKWNSEGNGVYTESFGTSRQHLAGSPDGWYTSSPFNWLIYDPSQDPQSATNVDLRYRALCYTQITNEVKDVTGTISFTLSLENPYVSEGLGDDGLQKPKTAIRVVCNEGECFKTGGCADMPKWDYDQAADAYTSASQAK